MKYIIIEKKLIYKKYVLKNQIYKSIYDFLISN
uniref:Uncharacterized protein n=1 Tax=viral metagenome TaxID=1070528 RepID=A0A6C0ED64_9ZZZZ